MKILSFDIESPDGLFSEGNICEFGYALADSDFNIIKQDNILIKPILPFVKYNYRIKLAYTMAQYNHSPTFTEQSKRIIPLLSDPNTLVIGHAIHNDVLCLRNAFQANNLIIPNFRYLDTQIIFSLFKEEKMIMSLDKIAVVIGEEFLHHRADQDAMMSLKSLKFVCNQLAVPLKDLIAHYAIELGRCENGSIFNCSTPNFSGTAPSISSKNSKRKLLGYFIENLKPLYQDLNIKSPFHGKKIALESNYEIDDITRTRRIIQKIVDVGARYSKYSSAADIFVTDNEIEDPKLAKKSIKIDAFLESIGELPNLNFDDNKILDDIKSEKRERLRPTVSLLNN